MSVRKALRALKHSILILSVIFLLGSYALAGSPSEVTIGYSTIGPMAVGLWMAQETGAFEKYGLRANLVFISSGSITMQALIGGSLEAALGATNAVVTAVLSGVPLVGVLSVTNKAPMRLFVQPEIKRVEDLKGKALGVTRFGSVTDNLSRLLLRRYGLEGKVDIRQMGSTMAVGAAFEQRAIAGAVTSNLQISPQIPRQILVKFEDSGIPYSMDLIAVTRDYYRRNPKKVEAIARAYIEGVAVLHKDKKESMKAISRYMRDQNSTVRETAYQDAFNFLEKVPRVEPQALQTIVEFQEKKGVPPETFTDNSIVDRLVREGFIDRLYKKP